MKKNKLFILIFVLAAALVSTAICAEKPVWHTELYKEIELFADTVSIVRANYVDVIKPKKLIQGALNGMLASLDPYSQFLKPENFKEMKEDTRGAFGGLGIEIGIKDRMLTVITPIDGTPAFKAGLKPGDVIVKIDGEITKDLYVGGAVEKLRGKPSSSVVLTIWREKEKRFFDVTIVRDIIKVNSVRMARILKGNIGYIRLISFQEESAKEVEEALKKIEADKLNGLILDLRYNAGGLLKSAIAISDLFLKKGDSIVSTKGRVSAQNREYKAAKDTPYGEITLALLVNEGSASASEIVAGAIKDNSRGVLVGKKTFGKGSVQTVIPLKDGSALRLTTAGYFMPKGYSISDTGIMPDAEVELLKKEEKEDGTPDVFKKLDKSGKETEKDFYVDSQIKAAMDIINAVNINKAKMAEKK